MGGKRGGDACVGQAGGVWVGCGYPLRRRAEGCCGYSAGWRGAGKKEQNGQKCDRAHCVKWVALFEVYIWHCRSFALFEVGSAAAVHKKRRVCHHSVSHSHTSGDSTPTALCLPRSGLTRIRTYLWYNYKALFSTSIISPTSDWSRRNLFSAIPQIAQNCAAATDSLSRRGCWLKLNCCC